MPLLFSTKAGTLNLLKDSLKSASIAPLCFFDLSQWRSNKQNCINKIEKIIGNGPFIVRSSCSREDNAELSNAGQFLSKKNVHLDKVEEAIEQVFGSYGTLIDKDEVLIQPMLKNVFRSGVAFSHEPNTCSPYRVINWSDSKDTSTVTGGLKSNVWQQAANYDNKPSQFSSIISLIQELLFLFGDIPIDCEFAETKKDNKLSLWLLQVRPLILSKTSESNESQTIRLKKIEQKIISGMKPHPFLMGNTNVYGVMPDWNPAEIIGIRPKPLALSLYRELITDSIWAYQRNNYGYRNLRSFPLMPHFFGLPYIDVRLSFNSFIPADLDDSTACKLVDHYIDHLLSKPKLHDKVEFEIVYSCYTLDLPSRLERLSAYGFSVDEQNLLSASLRNLTNKVLHTKNGLWRSDAAKLDILNSRRNKIFSSGIDAIEKIYWLLEDAKRYGTLPFAGLARAGFISVQMLRSLVSVGVFSANDYEAFLSGISTVSGQLARDRSELDKTNFLSRYGHLRPGTYDIQSPRYDEAPDHYFNWDNLQSKHVETTKPFSMNLTQMKKIKKLLEVHGLHTDPVGLFEFMQAGIELRELAKFHFSRNLSDSLSLISNFGAQAGFSIEDLAFCDISIFKELYVSATNVKETIKRSIDLGKHRYEDTIKTSLPPLITKPDDIWSFSWPETSPNFITLKKVTAKVTNYNDHDNLSGSIVCIENADPGFDWLFSYPIAGLITAWGGSNSHMAIRAGEIGLPAVIGAGELLFKQWSEARMLNIDCAGKRVEILE